MFPQLRSISKIFKLTDTLRILGITFDRKLKFKDHIAEQTKKACTKIYPPGRNDTTLQNLCSPPLGILWSTFTEDWKD